MNFEVIPALLLVAFLAENLKDAVAQCSFGNPFPSPVNDPITRAGSDHKCENRPVGQEIHNFRNGIGDFCVAIRPGDFRAPTTVGLIPLGDQNAHTCYGPPPADLLHAAGAEGNWNLLNHLTRNFALSYQPFDDLPYVADSVYNNRYVTVRITPPNEPLNKTSAKKLRIPMPKAPNPYFIEVTGISYKGELLHNFLHFRIFANMSVALGKGQRYRDSVLHGKGPEGTDAQEVPNFASGRISALVLMVKDQDGWPVGDFSTPVPCDRTCYKYSHDVHYGDERNAVPCSYTPPYASTHPGMFIYDADPGRYCIHQADVNRMEKPLVKSRPVTTATTQAPQAGQAQQGAQAQLPPAPVWQPVTEYDPRWYPETARMEGVREVHATWSFSHDTCNFVKKLYIQSLIFEDVEQVLPVTFFDQSAPPVPAPNPPPAFKQVLFGWTGQYNVLRPTRDSLGAADYVNLRFMKERNSRYNEIDCHVPLFDAVNKTRFTFRKGSAPNHERGVDSAIPSRASFNSLLSAWFRDESTLRYFGDFRANYPQTPPVPWRALQPSTTFKLCRNDKPTWLTGTKVPEISALLLSSNQATTGMRCPCPALPSEEPIENRTADPARLHGRLIHASHMAIAYMFLTPIGCFVARYYKETFVTVFCFQEYWWYMWHVVTLIVACLFNVGAITSIARKKTNEIKFNDNLIIHVVLGAISIFVFYMEMFTGFFRVANPKKRMRQIFMHWLIGTLNNACAVMSMFAMAWVDQSGFSCGVATTMGIWILFVLICYGIMEYNMRRVDKKLRLVPRRSYLPPPVKRLFTKEPPGRSFRMTMLAVFVFGLLLIQGAISYFIWHVEGGASCHEEYQETQRNRLRNALSSG